MTAGTRVLAVLDQPGAVPPPPAVAAQAQQRAVVAWRLLCGQDDLGRTAPVTRENRLDSDRTRTALRREAAALHEHLAKPAPVVSTRPTVVVVHRKPWLAEKVQFAMSGRGIDVVGYADDGADGSAMAIALTPSLLLLDAQLPSMSGCEVTRRVRSCCPDTIVTAQVRDAADRPVLLGAGATEVWGQAVLPVVVAAGIADLLASRE